MLLARHCEFISSRKNATSEPLNQVASTDQSELNESVPAEPAKMFSPSTGNGAPIPLPQSPEPEDQPEPVQEQKTDNAKKAKGKEVDWLPVEDLVASYDRVIIQTRPPESATLKGSEETKSSDGNKSKSDEPENDAFKRRTTGMGGSGGSAMVGPTFGEISGKTEMMTGINGGMGMAGPTREGRGLRFIAVRGIFDLATQHDKLQRALGDSFSMQNMQTGNIFDFLDFELERRTIVRGQNPAEIVWHKVDIESTIEILNESADYDPEIVNTNITNNVMTNPLPSRIAGFWGKEVTHPRMEKFTLTPEQIEQEVALNQHFVDQYKKTHAHEKVFKEKQKGFSRLQLDIRSIRSNILNQGVPEDADAVFRNMAQSMQVIDPSKPMDKKKLIQRLKDSANAAGRLLCSVTLDFDLNPGGTYVYRVRLVVSNPNFGRPIEALELPSVAEGDTRTTPWSNETVAVTVKQDVQYYLSAVQPPRGRNGVTATFYIYQWYPKTGTTIHSMLKTAVGEEIGGEYSVELYDVAKEEYDNKARVEINTQNYLVDAIPAPKIRLDEHPDLYLSARTRGVLPIDPEAIIVDNVGNLKLSLPPAASASYQTTKRNFDRERKALKWVKTATEARYAGPAGIPTESSGKKSKRKKSPIRVGH